MTSRFADVLVVGAGQAGAQVAMSLRKGGFAGRIEVIGDEPHLPYSRPMLSKEFMLHSAPDGEMLLRDARFWSTSSVDLLLDTRVYAVDPEEHEVTLADGSTVAYASMVLATGGSARMLRTSGRDLAGVLTLRSWADASELRTIAGQAHNAIIVGGGYLGLETASALRQLGLDVTVVEALGTLLNRSTSPIVSNHFLELHQGFGVTVLVETAVTEIHGRDGAVVGVQLSSGLELPADLVVGAVGMRANDELLRAAGAACEDGVLVDAYCRTSLPDIYAVGDCARRVSEYGQPGKLLHLECVQNSIAQAKIAARDILGLPFEPSGVPWFWSNQFDTKFKSVGLSCGYDDLVVDGDPSTGVFSVSYLRQGLIVARDCVNTLAGYGQLKKELERRLSAASF